MNDGVKKRKRGLETTQRILEMSASLFADRGYDNVSVREIALAVDVKESSLYNHFVNKQAILDALFSRFAEMVPANRPSLDEVLRLMDIISPEELLKNTILSVGRSLSKIDDDTARIIYSEMFRNETAASIYRRVIVEDPLQFYSNIFQALMNSGRLREANARVVAEVFYTSIITSTMEFAMARGDHASMSAAARRMMQTVEFIVGLLKP